MTNQPNPSLEVDRISPDGWRSLIDTFRDATVFQTWEYGRLRWGQRHLGHAVLRAGNDILAAAQLRTFNGVPGVRDAYVAYGPMWRRSGDGTDCENLALMMKALVREYVERGGYSLRVFPFVHEADRQVHAVRTILADNGFVPARPSDKTLILDISVPEEELRKNLRKKWRQELGYAERAGLDLRCDTSRERFAECLAVYREMHDRKQFDEHIRMDDWLSLHDLLPEAYKFRIVTVGKDAVTHACLVCSLIGDTALPVVAATAAAGLKSNASYVAFWEMVKLCHHEGLHWFDFRGVDAAANPGGYVFKTGIAGKNGVEVAYLGESVRYHGYLARALMVAAERSLHRYQFARSALQRVLR